MVDLIFTSVKKLSSSIWSNMADLIEKIDDMICSFEGGGEFTMDTVAMLIFGWTVLGLIVLTITKYVYGRYVTKPALKNELTVSKKPAVVSEVLAVSSNHTNEPVNEHEAIRTDGGAVFSKIGASRGGGKIVPPTPPLRKRLSTKKGSSPRFHAAVTPPTVTGPDSESVRWVNEVFKWLYSNVDVVDELLDVWLLALNEFAKKSVVEHGVGVEIVRILPETHPPNISNVFCECASNDDITITCDCEATPAIQLKAFRQRGEKVEVSHYRLNVNRFRARLNIGMITEKLIGDIKCDGWPDVKVSLAPVGSIKNHLDEQSLQDVISDIVVTAMRNAVVHLNLNQYPSCPRFSRYVPPPENVLPVHYDSLPEIMLKSHEGISSQKPGEKRLLVKVIQAKDLGEDCKDPYCVIEMDDPPQKNQTSLKKDTKCPIWNEHFLFDLNSGTGEILFEVYDRSNKKFLGLGIVGTEELLVNPNQRQIISLQPRPYETEYVTGTLTVEFMFINGDDDIATSGSRPYKLKETLRSVAPSGNVITTSKTVFTAGENYHANGGEGVTDSALKELELRNKINSQPQASKSTLIIHSVQRHANDNDTSGAIKVEKTNNGTWREVNTESEQGTLDGSTQNELLNENSEKSEEGRSRNRRRRRDFFGTIKKRFARSRTRSKSVDPGERLDGTEQLTRSVSADRMRDPSAHSTVPSLRGADGELSRRSSISDLSGLSGASARTFVNEASTLVLETIENGIKKHYLVPLSLAQKSKWRKKGIKLHIYNDHTFVAKHLSGNTTCQVCGTLIPRRFGKQGYECRDCSLKCHKACHVKADQTCPQSTIQNIEFGAEVLGSVLDGVGNPRKSKVLGSPLLDKKQLPPVSPKSKKFFKIGR